jgi:hypothetical protein
MLQALSQRCKRAAEAQSEESSLTVIYRLKSQENRKRIRCLRYSDG